MISSTFQLILRYAIIFFPRNVKDGTCSEIQGLTLAAFASLRTNVTWAMLSSI